MTNVNSILGKLQLNKSYHNGINSGQNKCSLFFHAFLLDFFIHNRPF